LKVTRLSYTKNKKRINVEVDNEFALSVEENTVVKCNLYEGRIVDKKFIQETREFDIAEYAFRKSVDYISIRNRSRREIKDYLNRKLENNAVSTDRIIDEVITKLEHLDLLDDRKFAETLIKDRIGRDNKSRLEIEKTLLKYGVAKDIYKEILDEHFDHEQENRTIENLITKKLRSSKISKLPIRERKIKISEYLIRKGFNWETIKKVLNNFLN